MKVVDVNPDAIADLHSHEGEALRRETVCATSIAWKLGMISTILLSIISLAFLLHVSHFVLSKSIQLKLDKVFSPLPNGTPPLVGVRYG